MSYNTDRFSLGRAAAVIGILFVTLVLVVGGIIGLIAGAKAFGRHQAMSDAHNRANIALVKARNNVQVTKIEISNQAQRVQVAQQQAEIRLENAKGVREAQDEISKTLTPLYVQFEMIQALEDIAKSGKNSSVVYIPAGANGVPLVSGVGNQPAVGQPAK